MSGGGLLGGLGGGCQGGVGLGGLGGGIRVVGGGGADVDTGGLAEADGSGEGLLLVSLLAFAVDALGRGFDERSVGARARELSEGASGGVDVLGQAGKLV